MARARNAIAGFLVVLTLAASSVAVAAPAAADGEGNGSPTNDAIAINTKDGRSVFKLAFSVRTITSSTAAPQNAAVAYASCTNCQTVAIAVQVVFVIGSPQVFTPENIAIAINEECSFCDTLATAYQFVVQSSVPVRLTGDGRKALNEIFKALKDLNDADLDSFEIQAKVDELMQQLASILVTEVVPIERQDDGPDTTTSTSTTSTTSTTTSTSTSTSTTTTTATTTTTTTTTSS